MNDITPNFSALRHGAITLHLITEENLPTLLEKVAPYEEEMGMQTELQENYAPDYDEEGRRTRYGFYATLDDSDEVTGFSLLDVDSWTDKRGSTGADVLPQWRGRGITPQSKTHLFYLAFQLLGLNRIETGCLVSNHASRRSLEKTRGLVFEGILREYEYNDDTGECEDIVFYSILRREWADLYAGDEVEVIP